MRLGLRMALQRDQDDGQNVQRREMLWILAQELAEPALGLLEVALLEGSECALKQFSWRRHGSSDFWLCGLHGRGHAARYRRPPPRRRERPERRNYIARLSYYLSMVL